MKSRRQLLTGILEPACNEVDTTATTEFTRAEKIAVAFSMMHVDVPVVDGQRDAHDAVSAWVNENGHLRQCGVQIGHVVKAWVGEEGHLRVTVNIPGPHIIWPELNTGEMWYFSAVKTMMRGPNGFSDKKLKAIELIKGLTVHGEITRVNK